MKQEASGEYRKDRIIIQQSVMSRTFSYNTSISSVEIIKAKGDAKNGAMIMKGIASTPKKDTQGDTLDPNGFELAYFLKNGLINWNHEWKKNPMSIIGKPTSAGVNAAGELEVGYYLFKGHKMAEEVYALSKAMAENGLQLGLSIEGKVLEADPKDPKSIKRAMITDLAITPHPINLGTTTEIAKGLKLDSLIDFDALGDFAVGPEGKLIVKAASTESIKETIPESLDKKVKQPLLFKASDGAEFDSEEEIEKAGYVNKGTDGLYYKADENIKSIKKAADGLLSKSEFTKLLIEQYNTSEVQAEGVFNYVLNYKEIKMNKEDQNSQKSVSKEDLANALEALSLTKGAAVEVIETKTEVVEEEETTGVALADMTPEELTAHKEVLMKGLEAVSDLEGTSDVVETEEEETEEEETEEETTEETTEVASTETETVEEPTSEFAKGLSTMIAGHLETARTAADEKFEAIGTLMKGMSDEIATLKGEALPQRTVEVTEFKNNPREIVKGEESAVLAENTYSVSKNKNALATKLTDVFLQKSEDPTAQVDQGLRGDLMAFEAGSIVTPRLETFAKGLGITILQ